MDISSLDIRLLRCFDALLREHHVSRAAERVGISQPAMSAALSRLRRIIDDPVLVKTGAGMMPTERAMQLSPALRSALTQVETAFSQRAIVFDPKHSTTRFVIAGGDYAQLAVLPPIIRKLESLDTKVFLNFRPPDARSTNALVLAGEIDLTIGYLLDPPKDFHSRILFKSEFVTLVSARHPRIIDELSLESYLSERHIQLAPSGLSGGAAFDSVIERKLSLQHMVRDYACLVPSVLAAARIAEETECLFSLPRRIANLVVTGRNIKVVDFPIRMAPFELTLYWHDRTHSIPAHRWLRELIVAISGDDPI